MKKILAIILAGLMLFACGCEKDSNDKEDLKEETTSINTLTKSETTTSIPEANTSEMVDYLAFKAKDDATTATDEDINTAIKWLRTNVYNIFDNNENMENTMYYGELLEYKYKDSENELETLGFQAFKTVKYVYRGIESPSDDVTKQNLNELIEMLEMA